MKLIFQKLNILCTLVVAAVFAACSGTVDDTVDDTVYLVADKQTMDADGKDVVTFTVKQAGVDISSKAIITANDTIEVKNNKFTTKVHGKYTFVAKYNGVSSQPVIVNANEVKLSKFVRKVCAMEFTATGCSNCPSGYRRLAAILDFYEDRAYMMALHVKEYNGYVDPYYIPQTDELAKIFKISAYPYTVVDMRVSAAANINEFEPALEASYNDYPAKCGISVSSAYKTVDNTLDVNVKLYSEKEQNYRVALYVVEDNVVGFQLDGMYENNEYVHHHVARRLISSSVYGDGLGIVPAESEVEKSYTVALDPSWNIDNVHIYALAIDEEGYVNNFNLCEANNGDSGYSYIEN